MSRPKGPNTGIFTKNRWNRVWAIGRTNYIRLYPNIGFGIGGRKRRIAVSLYGGLEFFRMQRGLWRRRWHWLSRVERPL